MERQVGIGKRIIALFLLIIIIGGLFSNYSFAQDEYKEGKLNYTYKDIEFGKSVTHTYKWMEKEIMNIENIELISGPATPTCGWRSRSITFPKEGTYKLKLIINDPPQFGGPKYYAYSTITIKWKRTVKNETKVISTTVNKAYSETLPSYLQGLGSSLSYNKPSGLTITTDGKKVSFKSSKADTYTVTFKNNKSSSQYYGSACTYTITTKEASSLNNNFINNMYDFAEGVKDWVNNVSGNINSGSSSNNSGSSYTPTYKPSIRIASVVQETPKKYMKKRKITINVQRKDLSTYNVSVTGKKSGNVNVSLVNGTYDQFVFYATQNDTFTISVKNGKGYDGKTYSTSKTVLVQGMDTTKPKIEEFNRVTTRGTNVVKLNIKVSDNKRLASLKVYDPDGTVIKSADYSGRTGVSSGETKTLSVENITKKGKYKVEVKDEAGNVTTKTQNVHVDTTAPTIKAFSVSKIGDKGTSVSTEQEGVTKISATTGDEIVLKLWIHEKLSEIENPNIKIGGKTIEELGGKFEVNCDQNSSGYILTKVTFTMSDKLDKSQFLPIVIGKRTDLWNNTTDEEIIYDNILYYDETVPIIKNCTFSGTTYAGEEISSKFIQITNRNTIKVSFISGEELSKDPIVTLMGIQNTIKSTNYTKVTDGYKYTTEFKFTQEQINSNQNKGIQEVIISNCVDKAGNNLPEVKYLEDSSKNVIITTGLIDGGIYLDITNENLDNITKFDLGDTNKNGHITSFDYIYEKVHINEVGKDVGDINQDSVINEKDLTLLSGMINNTRTEVKGDRIKVKLYVYEDNTYKVGIANSFDDIILSDNVELDRENSDLEKGIIAIKVLDDQENVTIRAGKLYGVLRINNVGGNNQEIEQIKEFNSNYRGSLRAVNRDIEYKRKEIKGMTEGKTRMGYDKCDLNDDGIITVYDAMMIQTFGAQYYDENSDEYKLISEYGDLTGDKSINSMDSTFIRLAMLNQYNKLIKDNSMKLEFIANKGSLTMNELEYDKLEWKALNENVVSLVDNTDKTATIKAIGNVGEHTQILVKAIKDDVVIAADMINIEIDDLQIDMEKMTDGVKTSVEEDIKELTLNQTDKETAKLSIGNIDTTGKKVTWQIEDENIATLVKEEQEDAAVTIEPKKVGQTKIKVTVEGENNKVYESTINLIVENNIEKVMLYHNGEAVTEKSIKLKINETYDFSVLTIPIESNENYDVNIDSLEVLQLSRKGNVYTIKALEEGVANIVIKAENGEVNYPVEVIANKNPEIVSITAKEKGNILKAEDEITITMEFDQKIKGDVPEMKLYFDENEALGNLEGVIEGNKIIYNYEITEEDNGHLYVGDITLAEGKFLTDETGNAEANLEKFNLYVSTEEDTEDLEDLEGSEGVEDSEDIEDSENIDEEEYSEELYMIDGIYVWQLAPELDINLIPSGDSFEVKEGDTVAINISASTELKTAPIVKVAGKEIKVTGEGTKYEAIVKIIKGEIPEGRLDVEVGAVEDIYENISNPIKVNATGDVDTVIVDYTKPTISNVTVENYNEASKPGDKIKIKVTFGDKSKGTTETVLMPTNEIDGEIVNIFPTMKLLFGGKEAKGNMTVAYEEASLEQIILNDPEAIESGEDETIIENIELPYSDTIIYTYTLTEEDKKDISIKSIKGTVYDMAGNESKLEYERNENTDKKPANNNEEKNNISNKNDKDNIAIGKLPYAGTAVGTGIISIIIGIISLIIRKRLFIK